GPHALVFVHDKVCFQLMAHRVRGVPRKSRVLWQAVDTVASRSLTYGALVSLHWILTGAAALLGLGAFVRAPRLSKRVERLTESYWELRYEYGQCRAELARRVWPEGDAFVPGPPER